MIYEKKIKEIYANSFAKGIYDELSTKAADIISLVDDAFQLLVLSEKVTNKYITTSEWLLNRILSAAVHKPNPKITKIIEDYEGGLKCLAAGVGSRIVDENPEYFKNIYLNDTLKLTSTIDKMKDYFSIGVNHVDFGNKIRDMARAHARIVLDKIIDGKIDDKSDLLDQVIEVIKPHIKLEQILIEDIISTKDNDNPIAGASHEKDQEDDEEEWEDISLNEDQKDIEEEWVLLTKKYTEPEDEGVGDEISDHDYTYNEFISQELAGNTDDNPFSMDFG